MDPWIARLRHWDPSTDCFKVRTFKSILAFTDQPLSILKTTVDEQKAAADQWARLAANLGEIQPSHPFI